MNCELWAKWELLSQVGHPVVRFGIPVSQPISQEQLVLAAGYSTDVLSSHNAAFLVISVLAQNEHYTEQFTLEHINLKRNI